MDFSFVNEMRDITYIGKFVKDGKLSFESVMFAGFNLVYTAVKP